MAKNKFISHEKQFEMLKNSYQNNFPNSWIFYGIKGIGKSFVAKEFIKWIIFNDTFLNNSEFFNFSDENKSKILNNLFIACCHHLNFDSDEPSNIDNVRDLIKKINYTNFSEINKNFILIDNFENLNLNSVNALLKTLEEPPKGTIIIIITHSINLIPRTLTSRCVKLKFNSLNEDCFHQVLKLKDIFLDKKIENKLFNLTYGSPGFFLNIHSKDGFELISLIEDTIEEKRINYIKIRKISEILSKNKYFFLNLFKSILYQKTKEILLENYKDIKLYNNIFNFLDILKNDFKLGLNIDINQQISVILIEYFNLVKIK